jgi:Family of unknown function (DUF6339)
MKENTKILTQKCCEDLLNFPSNDELREKYKLPNYDADGLEFLKTQTKYFIDDDLNLGVSSKDDCQNSIEIFKQLNTLDRVQANDKRLWVALTHTRFYNYAWQRWDIASDKTSDDKIIDRLHFEGAGIDSRMGNAISRLWWTAKVTYDSKQSDEFELTRLIWEKQDVQVALMERSFSTYPNIIQGFLEFFKDNKHLKEDELRAIIRGLNAIGGVKVLPLLSKQEVVEEIKRVVDFNMITAI